MNSVYTSRSFSTTSRYSPANHIRIDPLGVCSAVQTRRHPPTCTAMVATAIEAPGGPSHALKCSESVHIRQIRSTGASKVRSNTTAWDPAFSVIDSASAFVPSELFDVVVHLVESGFPHLSAPPSPGRDLFEWCGVDRAWPELGSLTTGHQPGPFENLDVLRDRRERQLTRFSQLVDRRLALGTTQHDRPPPAACECRKR